MQQIARDAANSSKAMAQKIAKQIAREPFELLNETKRQVIPEVAPPNLETKKATSENPEQAKITEVEKQNEQIRSTRLYQAYQKEIESIRENKLFKELQSRISKGEYIPLIDYPELSLEQREVLAAQYQAVQEQIKKQNEERTKGVGQITPKRSRRFMSGQKSQMQREQTRVEKPVPPSG